MKPRYFYDIPNNSCCKPCPSIRNRCLYEEQDYCDPFPSNEGSFCPNYKSEEYSSICDAFGLENSCVSFCSTYPLPYKTITQHPPVGSYDDCSSSGVGNHTDCSKYDDYPCSNCSGKTAHGMPIENYTLYTSETLNITKSKTDQNGSIEMINESVQTKAISLVKQPQPGQQRKKPPVRQPFSVHTDYGSPTRRPSSNVRPSSAPTKSQDVRTLSYSRQSVGHINKHGDEYNGTLLKPDISKNTENYQTSIDFPSPINNKNYHLDVILTQPKSDGTGQELGSGFNAQILIRAAVDNKPFSAHLTIGNVDGKKPIDDKELSFDQKLKAITGPTEHTEKITTTKKLPLLPPVKTRHRGSISASVNSPSQLSQHSQQPKVTSTISPKTSIVSNEYGMYQHHGAFPINYGMTPPQDGSRSSKISTLSSAEKSDRKPSTISYQSQRRMILQNPSLIQPSTQTLSGQRVSKNTTKQMNLHNTLPMNHYSSNIMMDQYPQPQSIGSAQSSRRPSKSSKNGRVSPTVMTDRSVLEAVTRPQELSIQEVFEETAPIEPVHQQERSDDRTSGRALPKNFDQNYSQLYSQRPSYIQDKRSRFAKAPQDRYPPQIKYSADDEHQRQMKSRSFTSTVSEQQARVSQNQSYNSSSLPSNQSRNVNYISSPISSEVQGTEPNIISRSCTPTQLIKDMMNSLSSDDGGAKHVQKSKTDSISPEHGRGTLSFSPAATSLPKVISSQHSDNYLVDQANVATNTPTEQAQSLRSSQTGPPDYFPLSQKENSPARKSSNTSKSSEHNHEDQKIKTPAHTSSIKNPSITEDTPVKKANEADMYSSMMSHRSRKGYEISRDISEEIGSLLDYLAEEKTKPENQIIEEDSNRLRDQSRGFVPSVFDGESNEEANHSASVQESIKKLKDRSHHRSNFDGSDKEKGQQSNVQDLAGTLSQPQILIAEPLINPYEQLKHAADSFLIRSHLTVKPNPYKSAGRFGRPSTDDQLVRKRDFDCPTINRVPIISRLQQTTCDLPKANFRKPIQFPANHSTIISREPLAMYQQSKTRQL